MKREQLNSQRRQNRREMMRNNNVPRVARGIYIVGNLRRLNTQRARFSALQLNYYRAIDL